jgi:hypothetical protein
MMKKLLISIAVTLTGCVTPTQHETAPHDIMEQSSTTLSTSDMAPEANNQQIDSLHKYTSACPFQKWDDFSKVKAYYGINSDPTPLLGPSSHPYYYHVRQYGVWIFFDKEKKVKMMRFDKPFSGAMNGISIGTSEKVLHDTLGEPQIRLQGLNLKGRRSTGWSYKGGHYKDWVRYDVDDISKTVRHIFALHCPP